MQTAKIARSETGDKLHFMSKNVYKHHISRSNTQNKNIQCREYNQSI